jgi:glyoxylate reductase
MSERFRVFVTRRLPSPVAKILGTECDLDIWDGDLPPSYETLLARTKEVDGILCLLTDRIDSGLIDQATNLRVISNFAVGFNNIDVAAATNRKIAVGNTPGVLTEATADIAVTLLLAAARRLPESMIDAKEGRWKTWEPMGWIGQDLQGKTVGIVGMGRIGFATAKRLHHGWGMNVIYTARSAKPEADSQLGAKQVDLDHLLQESDFVSVHCDLNPKTKGLFSTNEFKKMKPSAVFINTSRGPVVDQVTLANALRDKTIFAAGLDVTDPEPLPATHELFQLKNCVIAPHIASATIHTRDEMARIAAMNLLLGLKGEAMISQVNPF